MQNYLSREKIFAHPERLAEWIRYGITKPITAEIDPTNYCNHNCPKCSGNRTVASELSLKDMKYIIDEVSGFVKGIVFTGGGEPLLNHNTAEAINYASRSDVEVGLITNGSLLGQIDTGQILSNCLWLRISFDGLNPEHYAERSGSDRDEFFKILGNVKSLTRKKLETASKCAIGVAYLTDQENSQQLMEFARIWKEAGVDYVQFRPFHDSYKNLLSEVNECKSIESNNFKIIASEDKYVNKRFDYGRAFADEFRFVIAADGGMYPCCYTRGMEDFLFGNILTNRFEKVWNSDKRKGIAETKLKKKSCPPMCYKDPLNQFLWEIHDVKTEDPFNQLLLKIDKVKTEGAHLNFI